MFKGVFDPMNGFWRGLGRVCDIVGLSICWAMGDYARFFRTFRDNFKTATLVTLPFLALGLGIYYMWYVAYVMAAGGSGAAMAWLYACRILILVPLAIWLFAMFTLSRFTFRAGALAALVVALIVEEAALAGTRFLFTPVLVLPGLAALLCSLFMERLFAPYLPKEEEEREEPSEDENN